MKGNIDILYSNGDVLIKVSDGLSSETLFETKIDPETFLQASMGRLSRTKIDYITGDLSLIGKKEVVSYLEFEVPPNTRIYTSSEKDYMVLKKIADKACPEGWVHDNRFTSQGSFFSKDGKEYAKTVMRQWVDVE